MRHHWITSLAAGALILAAAGCVSLPAGPGIPADTSIPIVEPATVTIEPSPVAIEPGPTATAPATATLEPSPTAVLPAPIATVEKPAVNPTPVPTPLDPALYSVFAQARVDLSARTGVSEDEIELIEIQSVVWPDGGLGCPQPGMNYIQVQVDGLLIRLKAGDTIYEYHSGGTRPPFLCEQM